MKAMNEFQSLLVIAGLILGACALIDLPPSAPDASATATDSSYNNGRGQPTLQIRLPLQARTAW